MPWRAVWCPPYAPNPELAKRQLADLHGKRDATLLYLLTCGGCVQTIDQWSHASLREYAPNLQPLIRLLACMVSFTESEKRSVKLHADVREEGTSHLMVAEGFKQGEVQSLAAIAPPLLNQNVAEA
jgi:hypothetical protein